MDLTVGTAQHTGTRPTRSPRNRHRLILEPSAGTFDEAINERWLMDRRLAQAAHDWFIEDGQDALSSAQSQHVHELGSELAQLGQQLRGKPTSELLNELTIEYSFAWVDIARLLGVSVPAVRKWRLAGGVAGENQARLADLAAFVELFGRLLPTARPAVWMSTPLLHGYTVAPKHIYRVGRAAQLLDVAQGGSRIEPLLEEWEGDWRERYDDRGFDVERAEGGLTLRMR